MAKPKPIHVIVAAIALAVAAIAAGAAWAAVVPTPRITAKPPVLASSKTATFGFETDDDKLTFECSVDDEKDKVCSSPFTTKALHDGPHAFSVVAVDNKDKSDPATWAWTTDTTEPTATINSGPPSPSGTRSASFAFVSDESGSRFECALDGGDFSACSPPKDYSGLADGQHVFKVRATDPAGNTSAVKTYTWTVDAIPPTTTIDSAPAAASNSSSATFTFSSSDGAATFQCALDGAAFAPCASPQEYGGLGDGPHSFQVEASDAAGKTGVPASYTWTIATIAILVPDTTPPRIVGALRARVKYGDAVLSWQAPADEDFDHVAVSRTIGGGGKWVRMYTGAGTTFNDKTLNNGLDHRYRVVTYDRAGNASPAAFASVPASALLISPSRGARVSLSPKRGTRGSSQPVLAWTQIRGARFYNVQLFRGNRKILSRWPKQSRLKLPLRWTYEKHRYTLSRGVYHWYVWPAVGGRYGSLEGKSSFRVG